MKHGELLQRLFFRIRLHGSVLSYIRRFFWQVQGASIGNGTNLPRLTMNWPHQVSIGKNCILEDDVFFKFAASWQPGPSIFIEDRVFIGKSCEFNICSGIKICNDCLVASGCKFIDADHGTEISDGPMNKQSNLKQAIKLEEDAWLGVNVVVLKGVTIGKGAVVGAGAVVTKSIPAYEIWAGVPAKKIGQRC